MNAKLIINEVEVALGHKALEDIAFMLEDIPEHRDIFHELAKTKSSGILFNLVDKENLRRLTLRLLIEDNCLEVMRTVVGSRRAIRHMTRRDLENYLAAGDKEILATLAEKLDSITEVHEVCEKEWLCEKLAGQKDPAVRFALAENTDTPERFLEELVEDEDLDVARQAEKTLIEIREKEEEEEADDEDDEIDDDDDIPL